MNANGPRVDPALRGDRFKSIRTLGDNRCRIVGRRFHARYIAMTGAHVANTPLETRNCQGFIEELAENFATTSESSFDHGSKRAEQSQEPTDRVETTSDIEDIYHAIRRTHPGDIRLWSPVTEERNDGTKSRDPVWANSKTGTRLAEVDDVWIYRDGLIALDALQVVALEERIITDEQDYPSGRDFWRAVDALRARGADIPEYEADPNQVDASDHPDTYSSDARSLRALHCQLRAKTHERYDLRGDLTTLRQELHGGSLNTLRYNGTSSSRLPRVNSSIEIIASDSVTGNKISLAAGIHFQ